MKNTVYRIGYGTRERVSILREIMASSFQDAIDKFRQAPISIGGKHFGDYFAIGENGQMQFSIEDLTPAQRQENIKKVLNNISPGLQVHAPTQVAKMTHMDPSPVPKAKSKNTHGEFNIPG